MQHRVLLHHCVCIFIGASFRLYTMITEMPRWTWDVAYYGLCVVYYSAFEHWSTTFDMLVAYWAGTLSLHRSGLEMMNARPRATSAFMSVGCLEQDLNSTFSLQGIWCLRFCAYSSTGAYFPRNSLYSCAFKCTVTLKSFAASPSSVSGFRLTYRIGLWCLAALLENWGTNAADTHYALVLHGGGCCGEWSMFSALKQSRAFQCSGVSRSNGVV